MNYYDQLLNVFTFSNVQLLIIAAVTFGFGFWEYIYSFRLSFREKSAPFPIWMHTFYLAHDSTWALLFFLAAPKYNWHWFLIGVACALFIFNLFEIFNLYRAITIEREEIWGEDFSKKQALTYVIIQALAMYGIVNLFILCVGKGCLLQWFVFTNMVMAAGPTTLWLKRKTRNGCSMGLALVIVAGTVNTFLPTGLWVLAMPEVFNKPWFYITGVIFTLISIANVFILKSKPPKTFVEGQKKPIW